MSPQKASEYILYLCDVVPRHIMAIDEIEFKRKASPDKWSKKEILGHLIDSATNNHQRFVRAQFEMPQIYYEQNNWVAIQQYQQEDRESILNLWQAYNRHLAHVINCIPADHLQKTTIGKDGAQSTLAFLITDYLEHLKHHLKQILPKCSFEKNK